MGMKPSFVALVLLALTIGSIGSAAAGDQISWSVVGSGGGSSSSPGYGLSQTIGQTAVGLGSSAGYGLNQGFWQNFESHASCCGLYTAGYTGNTDCSTDAKRNLADITRLIDRVYISRVPLCCEEDGNVDGDAQGKVNLADITRLIDYVYISHTQTATCL